MGALWENTGPKWDESPSKQILNLVTVCLIWKGLNGSTFSSLLLTIYMSLLGCFQSLWVALLSRYLLTLASPTQHRLYFHGFTKWLLRDSYPFKAFRQDSPAMDHLEWGAPWKQDGIVQDLLSFMIIKAAQWRQNCHIWLQAWVGTCTMWTILETAFDYSCLPEWENAFCLL